MMRVLLDTNVIIAGIIFAGNERKLLNALNINDVSLVINDYLVEETISVLNRKFPGKEDVFLKLLDLLKTETANTPPKKSIKDAKLIIRDPKDAIILASAIIAKPDFFVSGDLDFHTSKVKTHLNVVHTKEAIAYIEYSESS